MLLLYDNTCVYYMHANGYARRCIKEVHTCCKIDPSCINVDLGGIEYTVCNTCILLTIAVYLHTVCYTTNNNIIHVATY